jgi:hypothetical protein
MAKVAELRLSRLRLNDSRLSTILFDPQDHSFIQVTEFCSIIALTLLISCSPLNSDYFVAICCR